MNTHVAAAGLTAVLAAAGAAANHATQVDCSGATAGAFTSLNAALATLPPDGPQLVSVRGACQESVDISNRRQLTISGQDGAAIVAAMQPPRPTLNIRNSTAITLNNITVRGDGIFVESSTVALHNVSSEDSAHPGMVVTGGSYVRLGGGTFSGNRNAGISIDPGATIQMNGTALRGNGGGISSFGGHVLVDGGVTLEENRGAGLFARGGTVRLRGSNVIRANNVGMQLGDGVAASLIGPTVIKDHRGFGIEVSQGASLRLDAFTDIDGARHGVTVENNGSVGMNLAGSVSANISGPHRIRNNGANASAGGIRVGSTSRAQFGGGVEVSGNSGPGVIAEWNAAVFLADTAVTNNTEEGVRIVRNSVTMLGGTIAGNGGGSVTCDTTGLLVLQTTAITGVRCARVEREHGPPRPGEIK